MQWPQLRLTLSECSLERLQREPCLWTNEFLLVDNELTDLDPFVAYYEDGKGHTKIKDADRRIAKGKEFEFTDSQLADT